MADKDRMEDQRPASESRGLTRRDDQQGSLGRSRFGYWGTSPFELMRRFTEDVDRMFTSFGLPGDITGRALSRPSSGMGTMATAWRPSVDIYTRDDDLVVSADLPGLKPEDVEIEAEDNNLIIRGESRTEKEDKEKGYWYSERSYGSFYRAIPLPQGVNAENAQAQFNNGVLEITFPGAAKNLQPQRRRIAIQGAARQPQPGASGATDRQQQAGEGPQATTG